jgi:rare lipoprotein A
MIRTVLLLALLATPAFARAESGMASWYSGGGTACGDKTVQPMSAAHRSLPCGTRVLVTTAAGRSVVVTIRDRGPFIAGRIIDLSRDAAEALGIIAAGVARVTVETEGYSVGPAAGEPTTGMIHLRYRRKTQ